MACLMFVCKLFSTIFTLKRLRLWWGDFMRRHNCIMVCTLTVDLSGNGKKLEYEAIDKTFLYLLVFAFDWPGEVQLPDATRQTIHGILTASLSFAELCILRQRMQENTFARAGKSLFLLYMAVNVSALTVTM